MVPMKMYTILYNNGHQFISDKVRKENKFILNFLYKRQGKTELRYQLHEKES